MQSEHSTRRCPRCGGASRTLVLSGRARRHHQCLACGHRHEDAAHAVLPVVEHMGKFASLRALPPGDRDIVEGLILLMLGTGTLVGPVHLTDDDVERLRLDRGPPSAVLRGFTFPVFSWLVDQAGGHASHFVAIDQGASRVCFRVRRRRLSGPL